MPGFLVNNPLCLHQVFAIVSCWHIPSCVFTAQIWPQALKICPGLKSPWSIQSVSIHVCVCARKQSLAHLFVLSFTTPSKGTVCKSDQYKLRIMSSHLGPVWVVPSVQNQEVRKWEFGLRTTICLGALISVLEKCIITKGKTAFQKPAT